MAVVGPNQFQVYHLNNDGRYTRKSNYNLNLGTEYVSKFMWVPDSSNMVIIMGIK
jgi:hypothetical protein